MKASLVSAPFYHRILKLILLFHLVELVAELFQLNRSFLINYPVAVQLLPALANLHELPMKASLVSAPFLTYLEVLIFSASSFTSCVTFVAMNFLSIELCSSVKVEPQNLASYWTNCLKRVPNPFELIEGSSKRLKESLAANDFGSSTMSIRSYSMLNQTRWLCLFPRIVLSLPTLQWIVPLYSSTMPKCSGNKLLFQKILEFFDRRLVRKLHFMGSRCQVGLGMVSL